MLDTANTSDLCLAHLLLRLKPITRALRGAAEWQAATAQSLSAPDREKTCITERHAQMLFKAIDELQTSPIGTDACDLEPEERATESHLRSMAEANGRSLPLDRAAEGLVLTEFEQLALLIAAGPELDRSFGRLFAYLHDDLTRIAPSIELICDLPGGTLNDRLSRRDALAPHGRLRRLGLLQAVDDAPEGRAKMLRLGDGVFAALMQPDICWSTQFKDVAHIDMAEVPPLELFPDARELKRLASALADGSKCLIALWGKPHQGLWDAAKSVAVAAGTELRLIQVDLDRIDKMYPQIAIAEALGAALWLNTENLDQDAPGRLNQIADLLGRANVPLILTGRRPWHPLPLLADRSLLDVTLSNPTVQQREMLWRQLAPILDPSTTSTLADRYQLSPQEMRAALRAAKMRARLASNGHVQTVDDTLNAACRSVVQRQGASFARLITPKRGPNDLILPQELHTRVAEVAQLYHNARRVDEKWGFDRITTGDGGIRVLMTGDSGTGKTAAAEVIAGMVDDGPTLLKVDLSSVVSKWVGETEKNLEAVFQHAEESHCVLFFDEADALFSKRGEVQRGADRYSNLEVGYLLQRLEDFAGLTILASNHEDQLDHAFSRRFQVILHFPRPGLEERRRLWALSLPGTAPISGDVDFDALIQLDLTGAGIAGAARMAALLAAGDGDGRIDMGHLVRAVAYQYQNEGRLMPLAQIGRYADLAGPVV